MNAALEQFFGECRADPWFVAHPETLENIEEFLTKIHRAGDENTASQALDDRICAIIGQKHLTLIARFQALSVLVKEAFIGHPS